MRLLTTLLAASALLACSPKNEVPVDTSVAAAASAQESEKLNTWFEQQFMEGVRRYPQRMAQLGIKERMDEWNDPSRAFYLDGLNETREDLKFMRETFDFDALDEDTKLSFRLWEQRAERSLEGERWYHHNYPFNQMFGVHSGIPVFLINNHKIDTIEDAENYIARLTKVDDYLGGVVKNSAVSFDKGIFPPKFVYPMVIRDAKNIISGAPFEESDDLNLLAKDFQTKVEKLDLGDAAREDLYGRMLTALTEDVGPAYASFITEMERQDAGADTKDGAWKLPEGDDFYAYRLKGYTTTDLTPDEVHDLGLSEVARIQDEMRAIMAQVEFDGDLKDFFEFLKTDPRFVLPEGKRSKAKYIKQATEMIDTMETRLPEYFRRVPKAPLEVRAVEAFREKSAGKAFYSRPAPDGSRPGYYYANLYSMKDMPLYQMEALAYHEGIPGHHMQIAISQELGDIPKFRKYGSVTAYSEGWGLYSEYLPKEMGFYSDPYSDFGRLAMEIWRAARLVVDTGLHHKQWTRQEAIDYLMENTPNPEGDVIKAIERYIVMPGQATAYKIGMMKILELREAAKEELGEDFDIRDFHEVILASGPVPLDIMEERVDAWVAGVQAE